ncbi:MAG: FIST N-terminal domain-containing protein [Campylobacterota bacterium]|nr:FIST N-terminal domain-containing protein [Campylobacterota bacterium]
MKTINTNYSTIDNLKLFLDYHNFNNQKLLIQIFSGVLNTEIVQNLLNNITKLLPNSIIIGSTTDGEILDGDVYTNSITISITQFNNIDLNIDYIEYNSTTNIEEQSYQLAKKISKQNTKLIITFADGLHTNGDKYLQGFTDYNKSIVISGGLSGDNSLFDKTYIFANNKILTNSAVAVSLSGKLNISTDYSFNWQAIGKELKITKSIDNVVYTIDDKTAFDTYKYYLGEEVALSLPAVGIEFPLIIKRDDFLLARAIVGSNSDGSLVFAGDIKDGDIVQFGCGNSELILNSYKNLISKFNQTPIESIFVYSCMARRRFMPDLITQEIKPLNQYANVSGFFTYGEFFTSSNLKKRLLNQTMTVLILSEDNTIQQTTNIKTPKKTNSNILSFKAISHLINTTTNELNNINEDLLSTLDREQKVIKERENMILTQSKMAAMGDMIGNIAHQWRQPLNTISVAMTAIQIQKDMNILTDKFFQDTTEKVITNVNYLADTITVFRNFLKEDKEKKLHSLQSIIRYITEIVISSLKDNHIALEKNITKENITITTISGEISQVFLNIINNARDAIIEKNIKNGIIKIELKRLDDKAIVTIQDNAGGIDQNIIEDIFKPYFTTKTDEHGTGLGLYMSYDIIVNNMKGEIFVKNKDNGAKFYIILPIS